ncbi:RHS repeat-associated core domain-containing protein [Agathobacter sp.]|uniref:RHS repeat-associated core domain-containing protein n=1 Tax=Agathobacter sp. TaxID=2021311 RepID=UPI003FD84CC8
MYNGLGDVTGLVDSNNNVVVNYRYDSWGKEISTTDTSGCFISTLNPFRYRRYVYDQETGLYCLGSRYYDPEVGRFISPDDPETLTYQMDFVQGKNLYQYCFNNPVNMEDEDGGWPKWVTQVLSGRQSLRQLQY